MMKKNFNRALMAVALTAAMTLVACQQLEVTDTDTTPPGGTDAPHLLISLGEKPAYAAAASPGTRAAKDYHAAWQTGDCVSIRVSFAAATGTGADGTPTLSPTGDDVLLTATCTAPARAASKGTDSDGNPVDVPAVPAQWSVSPAWTALPVGTTQVTALYTYRGPEDALTGTAELITATVAEADVDWMNSLTLAPPTWKRQTALVEVANFAPGRKLRMTVTRRSDAGSGGGGDGGGDVVVTPVVTIDAENNTAAPAVARFHLPAADETGTGTGSGSTSGTLHFALTDAQWPAFSPTPAPAVERDYQAGDGFDVNAGMLSGAGGADVQMVVGDGTKELDKKVFNQYHPLWRVTGGGNTTDDVVLANVRTALGKADNYDGTTARIYLELPEVTAMTMKGSDGAFEQYKNLAGINAPEAETIGDMAFYYCSSLTNISLPKAKTIGNRAFRDCSSLATLSLPEVTTIGGYAFYYCSSLTNISLPEATTIVEGAFFSCSNLTSISLPKATTIGDYAFQYCKSLTSLSLPKATTIGGYAFYGCSSLASLSLPEATTIGSNAFNSCSSLTSISLPKVTTIGQRAFIDCTSLVSLSLPEAEAIEVEAFRNCSSLTSISLPKATTIGSYAFGGCSNLTSISLPKATTIGERAFIGCSNLVSLDLSGVTDISKIAAWGLSGFTTANCDLVLNQAMYDSDAVTGGPKNKFCGKTWKSITPKKP